MKKIFLSLFLVFAVSSVYGPCFSFRLNAEKTSEKVCRCENLFYFYGRNGLYDYVG